MANINLEVSAGQSKTITFQSAGKFTTEDVVFNVTGAAGSTTIATSSGTNQITLAHGTKYAITAAGSSYVFTMPSLPSASSSTAGIMKLGASGGAATYGHSHSFSEISSRGEAYLDWGGRNLSGGYAPIDAAMVGKLGANRTAFTPASAITVQYSRNGGSTWTDYGASNLQKIGFFTNFNSGGFVIGKSSTASGNQPNANCLLRVILKTDGVLYTVLNKFVIYCSTSGSSGTYCKIDARLQSNVASNTDTWTVFANNVGISGWSGYNVINTSGLTTYGNTAASQYGEVRFTFGCTGSSTSYPGLTVSGINCYGGVGWTVPSTMAGMDSLFTYDMGQNATFPAGITATSFVKRGGTSSQFLKADGSVDSNTYSTTSHTHATSIATSTGTNQITLEHGGKYAITAGGTSYVFTMPAQYSHPTSAGNKHIPSGGASGQFLGWSASGTATWVNNPNTDDSVDQVDSTDSSGWHGVMLSYEKIAEIDFGNNTLHNFNGPVGFSNRIFLNPSSGAIVSMGGYYDANGNSVSYEGHTHDYSASNHTHTTTIATSTATNQITLAFGTKYAITAGGTSYVFTMPSLGTTSTTAAAGNHTHSGYLTSSSSLNAANLTGTIPSGCYTDTNNFGTVIVDTPGNLANKVGIVSFPYTLNAGNCFILYLKQDNTVKNATLNIKDTGAKDVYLDGAKVSASNWKAGTYLFYFDGERYNTSLKSNPFSDTNTTYAIETGDSNGQIKVTPSSGNAYNVNVKGLGSAAYTASTAYAASSHSHGSITSDGKISSGTALANGDAIVFSDSSDGSKLKKSTITFDGSTTTKFLSQKGTWETPSGGGGGSTVVGKTVELSTSNQALITVNGSNSGNVKLPDDCPWNDVVPLIADPANHHGRNGGVTPIFRADTPKVEINGNVGGFSDIRDVSGVDTKFLFPNVGKSKTLYALPVVMDKHGRLFILVSEALASDVFLNNSMSTDAGDLRGK